MTRIAFLVNPISGRQENVLTIEEVKSIFSEQDFEIQLQYSSSKENLEYLTQSCIQNKVEIIVACGGDGTINTIANHLIDSSVSLAVLPRGSGNGLATHLNIKHSLPRLHENISKSKYKLIDCGSVNGIYFFSNFALGYPADVIERYDKDNSRGFITYFKHSVLSFLSFRRKKIGLLERFTKTYSVLISNTKYMGYDLSLTPGAKLDSGKLELVHANSRLGLIRIMISTLLLGNNHAQTIDSTVIEVPYGFPAQIDGEPLQLRPPYVISSHVSKLKVIA
ncbi:hypothetical protein AAU57_02840 [Nonlabens sp. YIK11]|uniref:diacylglycerol/lipid kinase family protein n=1 Tax=Nonlabens sp. YIK11 TaxID=1453349 RepID=UPI0006DCE59A|nr:diacylglycerol kinase family protein [Nonlabens sp. YIK11]KQC32384.1 hypothetical protein AAU57_02840 [Nonlabens sp. YIK11]